MKRDTLGEAPLDVLVSTLEEKVPGFKFNIQYFGKGMPVMLNWSHTWKPLAEFESKRLLLRCLTAASLRAAFLSIHNRLAVFERYQEEERKKGAETKKKQERQRRAAEEREAARARRQAEGEPEEHEDETEADEEVEPVEKVLDVKPAEPLPFPSRDE